MSLLHLQDNKTFHNNSTIWLERHSIHKFKCTDPEYIMDANTRSLPRKTFSRLSLFCQALHTHGGWSGAQSIYQARQFMVEAARSLSQSTKVVDRTCGHPENGVSWNGPSVSTNLWHVIKKSSARGSIVPLRHILSGVNSIRPISG